MCLHVVVFEWKEAVVISKGRKMRDSCTEGLCAQLTDRIEAGGITGTHQYTVW